MSAALIAARRRLCTAPRLKPGSFFELRSDVVKPGSLGSYLSEYNMTAAERRRLLPGWLGIWKTELGGDISTVHHLYCWEDYDQRDRAREVAEDPVFRDPLRNDSTHRAHSGGTHDTGASRWSTEHAAHHCARMLSHPVRRASLAVATHWMLDHVLPLPSLRDKLRSSSSVVMLEATETLRSCGLAGASGFAPAAHEASTQSHVAWEMRTYQLCLGYSTVPTFLELYSEGLRDKLAADDSGASQLATLLYSDSAVPRADPTPYLGGVRLFPVGPTFLVSCVPSEWHVRFPFSAQAAP